MRLLGHLAFGYWWARSAKIALEKAPADSFYVAKLATARFYFGRLFTETESLILSARSGASNLLELDADLF